MQSAFAPDRQEVIKIYRRIHHAEVFRNVYYTQTLYGNNTKELKMGRQCNTKGKYKKCIHTRIKKKPEAKKILGRPKIILK
jgi:hypothetical protein